MSFPEVKWGRQVQLGMKCREVTSGWVPVNIHHKGGESQPDPGQWRAGWQASGAFGGPGHSLSLRRVLISPGRHLGWGRNPVVGMSRPSDSLPQEPGPSALLEMELGTRGRVEYKLSKCSAD